MSKFKAKVAKCSQVSVEGQAFDVDNKGYFVVPDALDGVLRSIGYDPIPVDLSDVISGKGDK